MTSGVIDVPLARPFSDPSMATTVAARVIDRDWVDQQVDETPHPAEQGQSSSANSSKIVFDGSTSLFSTAVLSDKALGKRRAHDHAGQSQVSSTKVGPGTACTANPWSRTTLEQLQVENTLLRRQCAALAQRSRLSIGTSRDDQILQELVIALKSENGSLKRQLQESRIAVDQLSFTLRSLRHACLGSEVYAVFDKERLETRSNGRNDDGGPSSADAEGEEDRPSMEVDSAASSAREVTPVVNADGTLVTTLDFDLVEQHGPPSAPPSISVVRSKNSTAENGENRRARRASNFTCDARAELLLAAAKARRLKSSLDQNKSRRATSGDVNRAREPEEARRVDVPTTALTDIDISQTDYDAQATKRRRTGRPPGSPNKSRTVSLTAGLPSAGRARIGRSYAGSLRTVYPAAIQGNALTVTSGEDQDASGSSLEDLAAVAMGSPRQKTPGQALVRDDDDEDNYILSAVERKGATRFDAQSVDAAKQTVARSIFPQAGSSASASTNARENVEDTNRASADMQESSESVSRTETVERQPSALDLLAEEATSVSKDSSGASLAEAIHLDFEENPMLEDTFYANEVAQYQLNDPPTSGATFATRPIGIFPVQPHIQMAPAPLRGAFTYGAAVPKPNHTHSHSLFHTLQQSPQQIQYLPMQESPPLTIAQQLSKGVDPAHPLIDPDDLKKGMTPEAALAKKARSPYVKWTNEEDVLLVQSVLENGLKWDAVSKRLPERSYHQCRQRWLRGFKGGQALPEHLLHLKAEIDRKLRSY